MKSFSPISIGCLSSVIVRLRAFLRKVVVLGEWRFNISRSVLESEVYASISE